MPKYSDREMNQAAGVMPFTPAGFDDDPDGLPCIDIHGVQIYGYVRDGQLVVSVHCDGDPDVWEDPVPVVVKVGDAEPVWSSNV